MSDAAGMVPDRRRADSLSGCRPVEGLTTFRCVARRRSRDVRRDLIGAWQRPQQAVSAGGPPVEVEVNGVMIVLGADAHKRSYTIVAVSAATGELVGERTVQVGPRALLRCWSGRAGSTRSGSGQSRTVGMSRGPSRAVSDRPRRARPAGHHEADGGIP